MRTSPADDGDRSELEQLNAEPWMLEYLRLNPGYVHWGPGEDYMSSSGDGWGASQEIDGWSTFGPWNLDEMNECVHFYFEIVRASVQCTACAGSGYNPATTEIADTFYDHGDYGIDFARMQIRGSIENARKPRGATGRRWCDDITQDEVDALVTAGRLREWRGGDGWITVQRTADEVNAANAQGAKHHHELDHDGINRSILIETRAKRLGVYGHCTDCSGAGYVFTDPAAKLNLVVWMLHPRKGCSRGVRVRGLSRADASAAVAWLRSAALRNAERFSGVVAL